MAIKLSISEVLNKCKEFKSVKEKAEWLQKNDAVPVRTVLRLIYDEDIESYRQPCSVWRWNFL